MINRIINQTVVGIFCKKRMPLIWKRTQQKTNEQSICSEKVSV